jgi:RHS repeat-associated protein
MGADGDTSHQNRYIARDAYGYSLNYYTGDYTAIGTGVMPFPGSSAYLNAGYRPLFNGNISSMAVNLSPLYKTAGTVTDNSHWRGPMLYNYSYDQLNRITGLDAFYGLNQASNNWSGLQPTADFRERVSYDGNGNIQHYVRNNFGETGLPMDSLGYKYLAGTNQLEHIVDSASDAVGGGYDLHNQPVGNYKYDSIGNLIKDSSEHISAIKWNVYGKITEIDHSTTSAARPTKNIYYYYDAAGDRVGKKTTRGDNSTVSYTWYVRDASSNVMATYTAGLDSSKVLDSADLHIGEKHIYGSSRLGIVTADYSTDANTDGLSIYTSPWTGAHLPYYTGQKQYELVNHLGNVLATITDKKIGLSLGSDSSLIDHYEADVRTAQDYYPFGMVMPGRMFTAISIPGGAVSGQSQVNGYTLPMDLDLTARGDDQTKEYVATQMIDLDNGFESGDVDDVTLYIADTSYAGTGNGSGAELAGGGKYRYGFNGKEQDNEVKGYADQVDYGFRIYDPRAGRFLSIDPLQAKYPWYSPYHFAGNKPTWAVDLDGREDYKFNLVPYKDKSGQTFLQTTYIGREEESWFDKKARQLTGTPDTYRLFYNGEQVGVFYSEQDMNQISQGKTIDQLRKIETDRFMRGVAAMAILHAHSSLKAPESAGAAAEESAGAKAAGEEVAAATQSRVTKSIAPEVGASIRTAKEEAYARAENLINSTPKSKLPRAVTAIVNTKTGQSYYGTSSALGESNINPQLKDMLPEESLEAWKVHNCAECDALNKALNAGSRVEDLEMHTVKIDRTTGKIEDFPRCENCKITTKGIKTTSDNPQKQ